MGKTMQRNPARRGATTVSILALCTMSAGCGDILSLKQANPSQLISETVYTPANAQLIVNGAIADFECAFARFVTGSGMFTDELANAFASSNNYDYDRRTLLPTSPYAGGCGTTTGGTQNPGIYTSLSTARGTADAAYRALDGWTNEQVQNRSKLLGQTAAYAGFSLVLLGEAMCSAAIDLSAEMTPAQLFTEAVSRFDKAIAAATAANDAVTANFARLGRARALLNLGNGTAAATDAALIPAGFVVNTSPDAVTARRQNIVFVHTNMNFWSTVDPSFRNLTLNDSPDPRVQVTNSGRTGTTNAQIWQPNKYPAVTTPMPIARYAQAQLIIAEVKAAAGDLDGAETAINAARNSGRTGMPQFSAAGMTPAQVKDQVIEERRRELFLEGHRMGDIRRLNLPLNPAPGAAFASGGVYGDQRCFPLPDVERINNPNIPKS